jgi:threonine dehydrogenase-like Zn-dependent dehydrogenase
MVEKNSAYVLYGREDLRCEVLPLPDLKQNEVLVELQTMGICGSDIHYFQHGRVGSFVPTRPFILGHEAAGTVIDAGSAVTVLCPGARVAINPSHPLPDL